MSELVRSRKFCCARTKRLVSVTRHTQITANFGQRQTKTCAACKLISCIPPALNCDDLAIYEFSKLTRETFRPKSSPPTSDPCS